MLTSEQGEQQPFPNLGQRGVNTPGAVPRKSRNKSVPRKEEIETWTTRRLCERKAPDNLATVSRRGTVERGLDRGKTSLVSRQDEKKRTREKNGDAENRENKEK